MHVVYVAIGENFCKQAERSASSVRRFLPGAYVALHTDCAFYSDIFDKIVHIRNEHNESIHRFSRIAKTNAILSAESPTVLYLDTDTLVISDISTLNAIPLAYDIAIAHDTWRYFDIYKDLHPGMDLAGVPEWVPYYNCGVVLFNKSDSGVHFLKRWAEGFTSDSRIVRDQLIFRQLVHELQPRMLTLSPEFNLRANEHVHISGKVRILHMQGDPDFLAQLGEFLNTELCNRIYDPIAKKLQANDYISWRFKELPFPESPR